MRNLIKSFVVTATILGLTSCANFNKSVASFEQSQDKAYLTSHSGHRLIIPGDLSDANIHDQYPIPNIPNQNQTGQPSLIPPGSLSQTILAQKPQLPNYHHQAKLTNTKVLPKIAH